MSHKRLELRLEPGHERRRPGTRVEGRVRWDLDAPPSMIGLRLCWYASGRGERDVRVVESRPFLRPEASGEQSFSFTLPDEPWSFRGTLITVSWGVEAFVDPQGPREEATLWVAPGEFDGPEAGDPGEAAVSSP